MAARTLAVTEAAYHADPCSRASLSHSVAHTLITQSPRHAWLEHPKLGGGGERVSTRAMDEGSILHKLLLGEGAQLEMVVADDWRTKIAKESRDVILAAGKIPILAHNFEKLKTAAERLYKNAADQGFPFGGHSEVAIEFTDFADQHQMDREVLCRCRIDQIRTDHVLYDVKKVRSANPKDYEVVAARLDGYHREIGLRRWNKALFMWDKLLREGSYPWPGYADGAITVMPPQWVINQELGDEAA